MTYNTKNHANGKSNTNITKWSSTQAVNGQTIRPQNSHQARTRAKYSLYNIFKLIADYPDVKRKYSFYGEIYEWNYDEMLTRAVNKGISNAIGTVSAKNANKADDEANISAKSIYRDAEKHEKTAQSDARFSWLRSSQNIEDIKQLTALNLWEFVQRKLYENSTTSALYVEAVRIARNAAVFMVNHKDGLTGKPHEKAGRLIDYNLSGNAPVGDDAEVFDFIPYKGMNEYSKADLMVDIQLCDSITDRQKVVLWAVYGEQYTEVELGLRYGVSKQAIHRDKVIALQAMRDYYGVDAEKIIRKGK